MFNILAGTGQGDPLSSGNFVITVEALNIVLQKAIKHFMYKTLNGTGLGMGTNLYADDNIAGTNMTTTDNFYSITKIYNRFEKVSGLKINIAKTQVLCINMNPALI